MSTKAVIAVDIGGKSIKSGFVTTQGLLRALDSRLLPFDAQPEAFFIRLRTQIQVLLQESYDLGLEIEAIGVGVPGYVDSVLGIAYEAVNLMWPKTNFKELIEEWSSLPTFIEHDVRCGAVGERQFGALKGENDFLYVAIGTGLGAAICVQGKMYSGAHCFGGELGHTIVIPGGRPCACGKRGCLEAYCSGKQIEVLYYEATGNLLSTREIVELVCGGNSAAASVWHTAIEMLAIALVNYQMIFDPDKIVIGGGLASAGERSLLEPMLEIMQKIAPGICLPQITLSALKHHSGLIGAGYQAYTRLHGQSS